MAQLILNHGSYPISEDALRSVPADRAQEDIALIKDEGEQVVMTMRSQRPLMTMRSQR